MNVNEQSLIVWFHIGRGGRNHHSGHITYIGQYTMQEAIMKKSDHLTIINDDTDGTPLPDADWRLTDGIKTLLEGKQAILSYTGTLDFDGEYNTDIFKHINDCTPEEFDLIGKAMLDYSLHYSESDALLRIVAENSAEVANRYLGAVATFNADPFEVTPENIADVAVSIYRSELTEVSIYDDDEYNNACARLDLHSLDCMLDDVKIYNNPELTICFNH